MLQVLIRVNRLGINSTTYKLTVPIKENQLDSEVRTVVLFIQHCEFLASKV